MPPRSRRQLTQAQRADKYRLYQRAVQEPDADIDFIRDVFRRHYGRLPRLLREDFCGTALVACRWVARHPRNRAWAVDLDPEPLEWARRHNLARLRPSQARRLKLLLGDALEVSHRRVEVVVALNFSYFILRRREQLLRYFRACHRRLLKRGLLVLDVYGGPDAQRCLKEVTEHDRFDYIWEQERFDPIHNQMTCTIHFRFRDRSRLARAFAYDWRLWTVPELRELLVEAGFASSEVYWEGTDPRTGEGDGIFTLAESAENCDSWIAYVVGAK